MSDDRHLRAREHHGDSIAHDSARLHVSGQAIYIDDMPRQPGELAIALALAGNDTGRIESIDIGPVFPGDALLASTHVAFPGQPIAAVAAFDERTARQAAQRVTVSLAANPPQVSIAEARAASDYVTPPHSMSRGDPQNAIANAPHRLRGRFSSGAQDHFYLEGQISLAVPGEDASMCVYSSTQNPTETQQLVAKVLGWPMHAVSVETRRMGGGFGGKETQNAQGSCLAALVSYLTGSPARLRLPRAVDMITTGKRHEFETDWEVGFDQTGRIVGLRAELGARCGYSPDLSAAIVDRALFHIDNCYFLDAVEVTGYPCRTSTVSNTAFRGFGGPQGMLIIENIVDAIARHIDLDPLLVRQRNLYQGPDRNTTHYGQIVDDNQSAKIINELLESSDYRTRRAQIVKDNASSGTVRRGIALTPVKFGISFTARHLNQAGALIHIYRDGSVALNHGGTEMGQGLFIKVAQIVAEELGIDLSRIRITPTSTDRVPNTSPTAASAGTDLNGMAALLAARELRERLTTVAATLLDQKKNDVRFVDDRIEAGGKNVSFTDVVQQAYMERVSLSATGHYKTPDIWYDRDKARGKPFYYFSWGAAVSEVEIDTLTGETRIVRADLLHDVGNSINPAIDIGQIEGGFVQGAGWLTSEDVVFDDAGVLRTTGPATYKIPTAGDVPERFNIALSANSANEAATVYRSKAVGEPPLMLAISVFLAIKDAISSVDNYQSEPELNAPATPEQVLRTIDSLR